MVKRREPNKVKKQPTPEDIEAFASGVDGESLKPKQEAKATLDPNANRDFKAIRVPFNEYEYEKLVEVATKTSRSKLNVMRWAILKLADELDESTKKALKKYLFGTK